MKQSAILVIGNFLLRVFGRPLLDCATQCIDKASLQRGVSRFQFFCYDNDIPYELRDCIEACCNSIDTLDEPRRSIIDLCEETIGRAEPARSEQSQGWLDELANAGCDSLGILCETHEGKHLLAPRQEAVSIITTTDSLGNSVILSDVTPGEVITTTDAAGGLFITTYTPAGNAVSSVVLEMTTLPYGQRSTITSFAIVTPEPTLSASTAAAALTSTSIHSFAPTTAVSTTSTTPALLPSIFSASATVSSSGGLSAAAKVGLGVDIPLGIIVIALLVAGGYFWGRRARKQSLETPATPQIAPQRGPQELDGRQWRAELATKSNTAEMPVTNETVEVSGSERDLAELWAHGAGQR